MKFLEIGTRTYKQLLEHGPNRSSMLVTFTEPWEESLRGYV